MVYRHNFCAGVYMGNEMQKIVINRDAMKELMRGSFEQRMQEVSEAVRASSVSFGGPSHLVSTREDRAIIFVEQRGFFETPYEMTDSGVRLGNPSPYEVTARDHVSMALRGFFEDSESLIGNSDFSDQLESILKSDRPWRQYILPESIVENVTRYLGESSQELHNRRYVGVDGAINGVTLTRSLLGLQRGLSEAFSDLSFAVAQYDQKVVEGRTDEEADVLNGFDEALSDLVENYDEIRAIVGHGIENARSGHSMAAAQIHDAVMEDMKNIHLGQQFAVKMISDLVTVRP